MAPCTACRSWCCADCHLAHNKPAPVFDTTFTERVRCAVLVLDKSTANTTEREQALLVEVAKAILRGDAE